MTIEIENLFERLARQHSMINSFKKGDNFEIQKTGEDQYPQMFFEDNSDQIILESEGSRNHSFTIYICELPNEAGTDYWLLKDKIFQIAEDFKVKLDLEDYEEFEEVTNWNMIVLKEWMGDKVVAVRIEITFKILIDSNNCENPWIYLNE